MVKLKEKPADKIGKAEESTTTRSGIPVKAVYTPADLNGWNYQKKLGSPGEYPYARSVAKSVARARNAAVSANQYAGFGTPEATNEWFKYCLSQGATSVSAALDLPSQIGYDSDHPMALGEVGKAGVSINSLADMEIMLDGIPIDQFAVGSVVSAIGPIFMAWSIAINQKRKIPLKNMHLQLQNDCLKEFIARGTQIFPIRPSVKTSCDCVEFCARNEIKNSRPMSVCGLHMRQGGSTAPQEMAFTLANAVAYYEDLVARGLDVNTFAPYIATSLGSGIDLFEEIAKSRAYRRMWARVMKEKFGSNTPPSLSIRVNGREFTPVQPLNNIVRATIGLLGVVLGGAGMAGSASYDEALALPTEEAVTVTLRMMQIVAHESGVFNTIDPMAGSYYVESLTDAVEEKAMELFQKVEDMGGAIPAIEQGFQSREIARSAYEKLRQVESGERVWVGVNKYVSSEKLKIEIRKVDPKEEQRQVVKVRKLRKERDNAAVKAALKQLKGAAKEGVNLIPVLVDVVKTYATVGEICDTLRGVYGEYKATGL
ncbi:MAG: methylmalonyl-CoA mutase family protein [Chloroflexota bacterium]